MHSVDRELNIRNMHSVDRELNIRNMRNDSYYGADCYSNAEGSLEEQLNAQAKVVGTAKAAWTNAVSEANDYKITFKEGGYCANKHRTKSNRAKCQQTVNAKYSSLSAVATAKKNTYNGAVAILNQLKERIASSEEAREALAAQGKTPESVIAETEAVIRSQETAQAAMSNRKKIIVIGGVVLALAITGFILYKKYKK